MCSELRVCHELHAVPNVRATKHKVRVQGASATKLTDILQDISATNITDIQGGSNTTGTVYTCLQV